MNKKRNYSGTIMFIMVSVAVLALSFVFWITWNNYYRRAVLDPFYEKGSLLLTLVYIIIYFLFSQIYGGYKIGYLKVTDIMFSQSISVAFTSFITYMQISLIAKKLVNPFALFIMTTIDILIVIIWSLLCNKVYYSIYPPIRMLMIFKNENVFNLMSKIEGYKEKYKVSDSIDVSEGLEHIKNEINKYEAVIICDLDSYERNAIIKYCYKKSIKIYFTPKITDILIQSSDKLHIFDTPLFLCKSQGLTFEQKLFKRIIDIIISLIAITILFPLMIIVALAIKVYDGGPVIFKQKRLTINDDVFEIYKFRSMIVDAEKDGKARLASQNDDRITPVGKIIRATRLDELPQLFNILAGDMSVVGPRPERPEIAEKYSEIMPEFGFRTKVKAGLTGYAQTMGKYNTSPYDKLKLDLMYIGNYSIFMDIKIIFMTVKIIFSQDSTEGIANGEILPISITSDKEQTNK